MSDDDQEPLVAFGSGNTARDLGIPHPDAMNFKWDLAHIFALAMQDRNLDASAVATLAGEIEPAQVGRITKGLVRDVDSYEIMRLLKSLGYRIFVDVMPAKDGVEGHVWISGPPETDPGPDIEPAEVISDPTIMSGEPTIAGMHIPAETILQHLRDGWTEAQIREHHPTLPRDFKGAVLKWAGEREIQREIARRIAVARTQREAGTPSAGALWLAERHGQRREFAYPGRWHDLVVALVDHLAEEAPGCIITDAVERDGRLWTRAIGATPAPSTLIDAYADYSVTIK